LLVSFGLTVGVHYLCRPFWFNTSADDTNLTIFEMFFTIAILPFSLVAFNYWLTKKFDIARLFIINAVIICSCIIISARLHFLNWADSVGSRTHPDNETLIVVAFERDLGLVIAVIGLIVAFVKLHRRRKLYKAS